MNRNAVYVRVLLVLIALVFLLAFLNRSPRRAPGDTWLPSSFNPVGAGHMAFFQTLEDLHWPVERWREPLSRLSGYGTGNTMIITRSTVGARLPFSDQETLLLAEWVGNGNTLVLLGDFEKWDDTRQMLEEFGFVLPPQSGKDAVSDFFHPPDFRASEEMEIPAAPGARERGQLVLPESAPLPAVAPPRTRILWQKDGEPYVLDAPYRAGHVVCVASPLLLDNAFLQKGDNLPIVLGLLAPAGKAPNHLFFEESHHGFSAILAIVRLLDNRGVRFSLMLALLGALTFFGSSLTRFGTVRFSQAAPGRSTMEFVDSIADLYQRADLRNDMIAYLFRETHQQLLHRLNLPPTASHEVISSRLQQMKPGLPRWKKLAQRFDSKDYVNGLPPSGWLRVARELIEIKSAMA